MRNTLKIADRCPEPPELAKSLRSVQCLPAVPDFGSGRKSGETRNDRSYVPCQKVPIMFCSKTLNCDSAIRMTMICILICGIYGVNNSGFAQSWNLTAANTNYDWQGIACSTNGSTLVAVAYDDGSGNPGAVYCSTNTGKAWVPTMAPPNEGWQSIACSANGSNLVAVANNQYLNGNPGPIYTSTNLGKSWKQTTASLDYYLSTASSQDGSKLAAVDSGMGDGLIYISTDFGNSWTTNGPTGESWAGITMSANGVKMAAVDSGYGDGLIYVSTDSGTTWKSTTAPAFQWTCIASSADGRHLAAANSGFGDGLVYISTNSGNTWNPSGSPTNQWSCIAMSADGTQLVAGDSGSGDGMIYVSTNTGVSWMPTGTVGFWTSVASSADSSVLSATAYPGGVYTWLQVPALNLTQFGTNALISWQNLASGAGTLLQHNSNLASTNWVWVTNSPGVTNGLCQLLVPLNLNTSWFYRLAEK
jgi:hypothetical protein